MLKTKMSGFVSLLVRLFVLASSVVLVCGGFFVRRQVFLPKKGLMEDPKAKQTGSEGCQHMQSGVRQLGKNLLCFQGFGL